MARQWSPPVPPGGVQHFDAARIGRFGVDLVGIYAGVVSVNFPAGSATVGDIVEVDVTITGVADGDVVVLNPAAAVAADVLWSVVRVTTDTVRLRATQGSASQDAAATDFTYLWFDLT
jgi:hypothetical protein